MNTYGYVGGNPLVNYDVKGLAVQGYAFATAMAAARAAKKAIEKAAKWCVSWRCKIEVHSAHHYFPELGRKECHIQLTCWRKGAKGSTKIKRWPYSCNRRKPPGLSDKR